ncbi:MAG: hypothetical protein RLY93_04675 [Sumerlaeia bacterium]
MTPRLRPALEALAVALLVAAFYWTHFDLSRMQSGGDFANLFWPMKEFRLMALREAGALPLWNPYIFMGTPAAATLQHATYYPLDWLVFWRSPAVGALTLYVLLHNVLAGVGAWFLGRYGVRVGAAGAMLAGVVWPCSAWFWGHQEHINQVGTAAWLPWIVGVAWMFGRRGSTMRWRAFFLAYSGLSAVQLLVGHPQSAFYTHATAGLLLLGMVVSAGRDRRWAEARRLFPPFLAAGVLAGVMAAVQLLPGIELSKLSYRQFSGDDPAYALSYSMPPDLLRTYLQPHAFGDYPTGYQDRRAYGEYGLFVGLPVLVLALAGAVLAWRGRRRTVLFLGGLIAVTLVFALGGNFSPRRLATADFTEFPQPALSGAAVMRDVRTDADAATGNWLDLSPQEILIRVVPTAASFRVPARTIVVAALAWALLAGLGLGAILGWLARKGAPLWAAVALSAGAIAAAWASLAVPSMGEKFRHPKDAAPLIAEFHEDRDLRPGRSLDDRLFRLSITDLDLLVAERDFPSEAPTIAETDRTSLWLRWRRLYENNNVAIAYPTVEGYEEGLAPTVRTKDFLFDFNRHMRSPQPDTQFLALLGVGRYWTDLYVDPAVLPPVPGESQPYRNIQRVPSARGAALWLDAAKGVDFSRLEGPFARGDNRPLGQRATELRTYGEARRWGEDWPLLTTDVTNPNRVVVRAPSVAGDAVVAMAAYPGWEIGGAPVEWLSAVHAFVPEAAFADGEAVLEFRPASHRAGLFLSAAGLAFWFGLLGMGGRRRG